jgi:hypothetical protein
MPLLRHPITQNLSSTLMSYPITSSFCKNKGKLNEAPRECYAEYCARLIAFILFLEEKIDPL